MNDSGRQRIRYISSPAPVSMGDSWYDVATLNHFWIRRRFEVLARLANEPIRQATTVADIGCGQGLLQRQIEDHYNLEVTGFDLNDEAMKRTASRKSPVFCYDLFEKNPEYRGRFDLILLFDVLEHLHREDDFIKAIQFHMAPKGRLVINVPAFQWLFSNYDEAAGHIRRYDIVSLHSVAARTGMTVGAWSYWGFTLVPLLVLRKIWLMGRRKEDTIALGFDQRGPVMNQLLLSISRLERIPQHSSGTSLMAVLENSD